MKESVYIESSVISYLTSRPSRDLVIAYRQHVTLDWWENQRADFELVVSSLVCEEIQEGEPEASQNGIKAIEEIEILDVAEKSIELAELLMLENVFSAGCGNDALHLAIAATQEIDYLLTWNFKQLNNAQKKNKLFNIVSFAGYRCPQLCSPEGIGVSEMIDDPIIEEIRKGREEHAKQFDYDLDLIFADLQEKEKKSKHNFVNPGPKRNQLVKSE